MLADWAAIAIHNGRLYRSVRERRDELERTIRGLETTTEINRALGGVTDLEHVLELVAKRSRALLDARAAEVALDDVSVFAGEPVEGEPALVVPVSFRNRPLGSLKVYGGPFGAEDERLLRAFAASAATAVATAQNAERGGAAARDRGLRGRARPLGAGAARRDAPAARRAADAALRRAPQRRPRAHRRGDRGRAGADHDRHRRPARADHRPAARRARRARHRARAGVARRALGGRGRAARRARRCGRRPSSSRRSTGSSRRR